MPARQALPAVEDKPRLICFRRSSTQFRCSELPGRADPPGQRVCVGSSLYRLARDIRDIGFKSADLIAEKLGIEKTAMIRARAGVGYALTEAMDDGHCGLPHEQLLTMAAKLFDVPAAIIEGALVMELQDGEVVADTVDARPCNFLAGLHRAERAAPAGRSLAGGGRRCGWRVASHGPSGGSAGERDLAEDGRVMTAGGGNHEAMPDRLLIGEPLPQVEYDADAVENTADHQ
jgi:Helix-hairpin-helix containing domain